MKKIFLVGIGLILAITISSYLYINFKFSVLKDKTYEHLLSQGYEKNDILSVNTKIKKLSLFTAEVTFKDEPKISYDYKIDDSNNKVYQIGLTDESVYLNFQTTFKHIEEPE